MKAWKYRPWTNIVDFHNSYNLPWFSLFSHAGQTTQNLTKIKSRNSRSKNEKKVSSCTFHFFFSVSTAGTGAHRFHQWESGGKSQSLHWKGPNCNTLNQRPPIGKTFKRWEGLFVFFSSLLKAPDYQSRNIFRSKGFLICI